MDQALDRLIETITRIPQISACGRIVEIGKGTLRVGGLSASARLGDRIQAGPLQGEIVALAPEAATVLTEGPAEGLGLGTRVILTGQDGLAPDNSWIGRILDPYGRPLDGRPLRQGPRNLPLRPPAPPAAQRRPLGLRMSTGLAAFDTLLPLAEGQRIGLFAGSGVGKSTLLGQLARGLKADVLVIALIGERGRELRDFVETVLGPEGLARAVIVTATADQSALARRRCAWAAMTVAEFFRDRGQQVLFLADSITRFAEAHREVALAAGETPALRGFPPSLTPLITGLAERAGPGCGPAGDITAVFSVLVAGSDMEEPIADILRGVLDGHVVLDRRIAERGRFPAIDLLRSVSRSLPAAATPEQNTKIQEARRLLGAWDNAELMVQAGLYVRGSDPGVDRAIAAFPALDAFLAAASPDGVEASFDLLSRAIATAAHGPRPAAGIAPAPA